MESPCRPDGDCRHFRCYSASSLAWLIARSPCTRSALYIMRICPCDKVGVHIRLRPNNATARLVHLIVDTNHFFVNTLCKQESIALNASSLASTGPAESCYFRKLKKFLPDNPYIYIKRAGRGTPIWGGRGAYRVRYPLKGYINQ